VDPHDRGLVESAGIEADGRRSEGRIVAAGIARDGVIDPDGALEELVAQTTEVGWRRHRPRVVDVACAEQERHRDE